MENDYSMKNWNVAPPDRGSDSKRVPVYSASELGSGGIQYFKPELVEPKGYIRSASIVAKESPAGKDERYLEKVGESGSVHDTNTREGRRGLAKDMGLRADKKKKRK
jgi:hypothetical protein